MRSIALAIALAFPSVAAAQSRFSDAESRARESSPETFADEVSTLLRDCSDRTGAAKRSCVNARHNEGRELRGSTFLVELPARDHLRFGSYERIAGGFRVRLRGLAFRRESAPGVLATAPTLAGRLPHAHIAREAFIAVPAEGADDFLATHELDDYSVRVLLRLGQDFEDRAAASPNDRFGIRLEVVGMQVYGNRRGDVLVDSFAAPVPAAPSSLEQRTRLLGNHVESEGVFVSNEGTEVILGASETADSTSILSQTVGAQRTELLRASAASIDIRRHGAGKLLAILTENGNDGRAANHGRVVLLRWNDETRRFETAAEWTGANGSEAPSWVLDPESLP